MRTFAHSWLLFVLALLPVLAMVALTAARRRRVALIGLGAGAMDFLRSPRWPRRTRALCVALGLTLLVVGAAGPQWGRTWDESAAPGRDLVVVLDRSRSMLAETPSRLSRARDALLDLVDGLSRRGGHRVALAVFAGQARLVCPLTHDYAHFREMVSSIDPDALDPDLAPPEGQSSGTRIGLALTEAVRALGGSNAGDVLLLSDGDDPARDGEWRAGIAAARAADLPVLVVSVGDAETAHPVRLEHDGKPVLSRLEEGPLREIAASSGGLYEPTRTLVPPLGSLVAKWIASRPVREDNADALPVARQRPTWFLATALALLTVAMTLSDRRPATRRPHES